MVDLVCDINIHEIKNQKIICKKANANKMDLPNRFFVGGLSKNTTAEQVNAYFNRYGNVVETILLNDQTTQRQRGFAFVIFENKEDVNRVYKEKTHFINNKEVDCTPAKSSLQ